MPLLLYELVWEAGAIGQRAWLPKLDGCKGGVPTEKLLPLIAPKDIARSPRPPKDKCSPRSFSDSLDDDLCLCDVGICLGFEETRVDVLGPAT